MQLVYFSLRAFLVRLNSINDGELHWSSHKLHVLNLGSYQILTAVSYPADFFCLLL